MSKRILNLISAQKQGMIVTTPVLRCDVPT